MAIIGNRRYPDDYETVMRKSKLAELLAAQLKAEYDYHLMEFLEEKFDPEHLFNTYMQNDIPKGVNVSSVLFDRAAEMAGDWGNKGWAKIVNDTRNAVKIMIQDNALTRMYKTEEFLAYHKAQGGTLEKPANAPPATPKVKQSPIVQAATRLGFENVEMLRKYIGALEKFGDLKVRPVAEKMLRAENSKVNVDTLNAFLYQGKFAKQLKLPDVEPLGGDGPEIKLNKKVLRICGFENLRGDKVLDRIREFILAMHNKDKRAAEVVYAKIMKEEPLNSMLHNEKLIDIFKRMQKRNAFEML